MNDRIAIIITSVDDASKAKLLARALVEERLAACVQISAGGTSIYHWDDAVQESTEYYLSIKAPVSRCDEIIDWLQRLHPYDTPEIIVLEAQAAKQYADWVAKVAAVSIP